MEESKDNVFSWLKTIATEIWLVVLILVMFILLTVKVDIETKYFTLDNTNLLERIKGESEDEQD